MKTMRLLRPLNKHLAQHRFRHACCGARRHFHGCSPSLQQAAAVSPAAASDFCNDQYFVDLGRRPSDKVIRIADEMFAMSILEVSDVADLLKKKLKIGNLPMGMGGGMAMQAGGAGAAAPVVEEKKEKMTFEVKLEKFEAASKIKIIKEVRAFTSLGLKEAKELVEKAPTVVKSGVSKEEATDIVEKLKAVGATVVME